MSFISKIIQYRKNDKSKYINRSPESVPESGPEMVTGVEKNFF